MTFKLDFASLVIKLEVTSMFLTFKELISASEVTFSEVNNYIREETESVNFVLDENGDQIVL